MNIIYRQGDVLLEKVASLPKAATPMINPEKGRLVLAYGEVTGHAHAIDSKLATMYQWEGDRLIDVRPGAQLLHEEHAAVVIEPGVYKVVQQREYSPEEIRNVAD